MTVNYGGNSKKSREPAAARPEKNLEKVITGDAQIKKKGLGTKAKDLFVEADFKSVANYVLMDVFIPAARNMIVDTATKGIERMFLGEGPRGRGYGYGPGPKTVYNNPINRGYPGGSIARSAPPITVGSRTARSVSDDILLTNRSDAEAIISTLQEVIERFDYASIADLKDLAGIPSTHVDNDWGWVSLGDARVVSVRDGFMLDLPLAEPIG